jgi:hypothetical protein
MDAALCRMRRWPRSSIPSLDIEPSYDRNPWRRTGAIGTNRISRFPSDFSHNSTRGNPGASPNTHAPGSKKLKLSVEPLSVV